MKSQDNEKSWLVGLCRHQHLHVARQSLRDQVKTRDGDSK